jgi:transketolase
MSDSQKRLEELCINCLRMLSADAVQQANSGHPGLPLGAAPMAYVLWTRFMRFNPKNPRWFNRDRYVHSAGHGSALLYALLHMTGYDLSLDELKRFRQWKSKTAGHPEYDLDHGVEATTGPLGQGFGMGVGMAIVERFLARQFNRPGFPVVDHFTYAIVSDGDLMEGVASEAASLAGHLRLGKLIYLYDDNHISIEGDTALTFTESVEGRFKAYGWHVQRVPDGNDVGRIEAAIRRAQLETERPSLIMVRTHIGFGSPKQDSASAHGEPLGEEGLKATKENLSWPLEPRFHVPEAALSHFRLAVDRGRKWENEWENMLVAYKRKFGALAESLERQSEGELPPDWDSDIPVFDPRDGSVATRVASGEVLNAIAKRVPNLLGGSADLAPSTKTLIAGSPDQGPETPGGRNLRFGVREHAMGAVVNGMALHGGVIPYGATFLIFSDYMRPCLRVAALMNVHSIFVLTHDSIAVGEDGPTHQPVEHLISLRAIPNFTVIRPADANETAAAWKVAMTRPKPVALILTRQKLPILDSSQHGSAEGLYKGAYVISDVEDKPDMLILATGSEVSLALQAQDRLVAEHGIKARIISMPCWELFEEQSQEYRDQVLPPEVKIRLAVEAGSHFGWAQWTGTEGDVISVDRFGASAPGPEVMKQYGFTVDNVVSRAVALVRGT